MKLTQILGKQHLERMARRHWYIQGKKKLPKTKAEENVLAKGIPVYDAVEEFIKQPIPSINFDLKTVSEAPLPFDESHPEYKEDPCFIYGDQHTLVGGTAQAQVLTNTTVVPQLLSESGFLNESKIKIPNQAHEQFKNKILLSCALDAEQKKLPKRKDPLRPAWNFPRDFGITDVRKNYLICNHMSRISEQLLKKHDFSFVEDVTFSLPLQAHGKQLKFELGAEMLVVKKEPLSKPIVDANVYSSPLPDLTPMHCTISIQPQNFYNLQLHYPFGRDSVRNKVHTALLHYNNTQVQNLYDSPVTPDQMQARLLLKAFCIAACQASALQPELKSPVTVQAIQTDGRLFAFAVYLLNTLDVEGKDGKRNLCWIDEPQPLYSTCEYVNGRPVLEGYNPNVLQRFLDFLSNR